MKCTRIVLLPTPLFPIIRVLNVSSPSSDIPLIQFNQKARNYYTSARIYQDNGMPHAPQWIVLPCRDRCRFLVQTGLMDQGPSGGSAASASGRAARQVGQVGLTRAQFWRQPSWKMCLSEHLSSQMGSFGLKFMRQMAHSPPDFRMSSVSTSLATRSSLIAPSCLLQQKQHISSRQISGDSATNAKITTILSLRQASSTRNTTRTAISAGLGSALVASRMMTMIMVPSAKKLYSFENHPSCGSRYSFTCSISPQAMVPQMLITCSATPSTPTPLAACSTVLLVHDSIEEVSVTGSSVEWLACRATKQYPVMGSLLKREVYWQQTRRRERTASAAAMARAAVIFSPAVRSVESMGMMTARMSISKRWMPMALRKPLRYSTNPRQKEMSALVAFCTRSSDILPTLLLIKQYFSQSLPRPAVLNTFPFTLIFNSPAAVIWQIKIKISGLFQDIIIWCMRKLTIFFWLLFWLFVYKLAFLEKDDVLTDRQFSIFRDPEGVPHIFARSYSDIFFGLGYAQGQDRLFSIQVKKFLVEGRLAELFGPEAALSDLEFRNIGFLEMGKTNLGVTDGETKGLIQAYVDGLNTYARSAKLLPLEYYLFWIEWEDWQVENCLAHINFLSFNLEFDWLNEIARQRLLETMGYNLAIKIISYGSSNLFRKTTIIDDQQLRQMGRFKLYDVNKQVETIKEHWSKNISLDKVHMPDLEHTLSGVGSNAWAIGGNHTNNGRPLLASDPHVASILPSLFYVHEAVLLDKDNNVKNRKFGAMVDGIPSVSIGVGLDFSYGSTAAYIDTKDVYYQTVRNISGKLQYLFKDEWHDFRERKEVIKVRGAQDIEETYYHTHRGVVIETIFLDLHWKYGYPLPTKYKNNHTLTLVASHYIPDNTSAKGHVGMLTSRTFEEMKQATKLIQHPNIDSVFILSNGSIGYNSVGSIPKRDIPEMGSFIKNGNSDLYDFKGMLSDEEEPFIMDPNKGFISMANNKFASEHYEFRSSLQEIVTGRSYHLQSVIKNKLARKEKFTLKDIQKMQLDVKDAFASEILPSLIKKLEEMKSVWSSDVHEQIISKLKQWDHVMDKNSVEAAFYMVWEYIFQHSLFSLVGLTEEELHSIVNHGYFESYQFTLLSKIVEGKLTNQERPVCQSLETRKLKHLHPCEASVVLAFKQLPSELRRLFNSDKLEDYRWGVIHNQVFKMIPMSEIPLLNKVFQRSYPASGNSRTLNVGIITHQSKSYNNVGNAVFRLVTDINTTYFNMDIGESGNVFSPFYDNFVGTDRYVLYERKNPFLEELPEGWTLAIGSM